MHITMVKKRTPDGEPCAKCAEVERKLIDAGLMDRIDRILIIDDKDGNSEGALLARCSVTFISRQNNNHFESAFYCRLTLILSQEFITGLIALKIGY